MNKFKKGDRIIADSRKGIILDIFTTANDLPYNKILYDSDVDGNNDFTNMRYDYDVQLDTQYYREQKLKELLDDE